MEMQAVAESRPSGIRGFLLRPTVAILAVALLAGGLRVYDLGTPNERIFDEFYYSKSACIFLGWSQERCSIESKDEKYWFSERFDTGAWVHPPLGKWAIALGELAVGTDASDGISERDAFGYRIASAVTGTLTVVLFAVMVQLLFGSVLWTTIGGLLLATEGLSIVQSRVAMLDVFVGFWILAAFLSLVLDRRWIQRRTPTPPAASLGPGEIWLPPQPEAPSPLWRPWRSMAGLMLGLGIATKWSAFAAIVGVAMLAFGWECVRRRHNGEWNWLPRTIAREGFGLALALLVLPLIVYVASYAGWFMHYGWELNRWGELQLAIFRYHADLKAVNESGEPLHPYLSSAWWWLLLARPVLYYADYLGWGARRVIYANGNPAIFWGSFLALPTAAIAWIRARDWRAGIAVVGFLSLYLPWLLVSRAQFLFYALPIVPFLVLAMIVMLRELVERGYTPLAVGLVSVALMLTVLFWPTYVGHELDSTQWQLRSWFPSWT